MNAPAWLVEFHRQWHVARGRKLEPSARPFSRSWNELLDAATLRTAAERSTAEKEAEAWEAGGRLRLRRHQYRRYLIESVALPVAEEDWLVRLMGGRPAWEVRAASLQAVGRLRERGDTRWPESWQRMCDALSASFSNGQNLFPFLWSDPEGGEKLAATTCELTRHDWPQGTLVREASEKLGLGSKGLEQSRRSLEAALTLLFGEETSFEALGLVGSESRVMLHGPLQLVFNDGTTQAFDQLQGEFTVSLTDLLRCVRAETTADRILSIENAKTPFPRAVAANRGGEALILATSFPNGAAKRLLQILPSQLSHFHFGDTDVSGYAILRSLRMLEVRPVRAFLMDWRDEAGSAPLSERDRSLLPGLMESPWLEDCRSSLRAMEASGRKGRYEQERFGAPQFARWPFWEEFGE